MTHGRRVRTWRPLSFRHRGPQSAWTALLRLLEGLSNSSGLVVGNLEAVEFLQSARDIGGDFETIQNHMNRMILRALLVPALVLENTEVGSYALGTQHFNVFLLGLESILEEASEVLLEQFVRRLLTWNFGSRLKSWGSFVMQPLQPDDLKLFADIFATLTNAGYMTPELRADLNAVRKRFGLDPVESLPALPLPAEGEGEPPGEQPGTEGPEDLEAPDEAEDPDDAEEDPAERDRLLAQTTYFAERYHARRR